MAGDKTFDSAIKNNAEDFRKKMMRTVKRATKEAMRNVNNHALSCLQEYYGEYNPTSYRRTDSLRHAIWPTYYVADYGNYIVCEAGVEFDAAALDSYAAGEPGYDASNKYVVVDPDWLIINYLEGIHPRTNGSSIPEEVDYTPYIYLPTPNEKMTQYIDGYQAKFISDIYAHFHL